MRGWVVGAGCVAAFLCQIVFEPALGIMLLFLTTSYLATSLARALAAEADTNLPQI
jgi:hypothetical protein